MLESALLGFARWRKEKRLKALSAELAATQDHEGQLALLDEIARVSRLVGFDRDGGEIGK